MITRCQIINLSSDAKLVLDTQQTDCDCPSILVFLHPYRLEFSCSLSNVCLTNVINLLYHSYLAMVQSQKCDQSVVIEKYKNLIKVLCNVACLSSEIVSQISQAYLSFQDLSTDTAFCAKKPKTKYW